MSGHSKWATIKRAKAATDAKRGATFTKLANLITIAARDGGGDPSVNFSLRMAMDKAKNVNMPKNNIERAIKRGTGELAGDQLEEIIYEGIGPLNSQFVVKVVTDNRNRSAAEIRHVFTKFGGSFGAVLWNFSQSGVVRIAKQALPNIGEELELELIEIGADDIDNTEDGVIIYTDIKNLQVLKKFLEDKDIKTESAEIEYIANEKLTIDESDSEKLEKFINALEENDDVSDYYSNIA